MNLNEQEPLIMTAKILAGFLQGVAEDHGIDLGEYSAEVLMMDIETGQAGHQKICIQELVQTVQAIGSNRDHLHS